MKAEYTININAPVETVFECVDNDDEVKKWLDDIIETTYPEGRDTSSPVGTKFIQKIRENGRIKEYSGEVVKYDKPHLLVVKLIDKGFDVEVSYSFAEIPGGTQLSYEADIVFKTLLMKIVGKSLAGSTQKMLEKQMLKLKALAESKV